MTPHRDKPKSDSESRENHAKIGYESDGGISDYQSENQPRIKQS